MRERKKRGEGGRGRDIERAERERDAVYCCVSTRLRDTNHVSPAPRPITNTHIDSLRRRGVENTGIDTVAVNSREAYTLIYTKQRCKFTGLTCSKYISSSGIGDFDTSPPHTAYAGECMRDGSLPVGQRICCIFCRWCGRCCQSRWHWWDIPAKRRKAKLEHFFFNF